MQLGGRGFGLLEAAIPLGIVAGFIVAPKVARGRGAALVALLVTLGYGFIGFLDDWLKLSKRNSKGLAEAGIDELTVPPQGSLIEELLA